MADPRVTITLPSLVGSKEFAPSGLMMQTLCAYLDLLPSNPDILPIHVLKQLNHNSNNWYHWQKKRDFKTWWCRAIGDYMEQAGLARVHKALYVNALTPGGSTDRKTYYDRWDKDFKPATQMENTVTGVAPPDDLQIALERSQQRTLPVESVVIDATVQDTHATVCPTDKDSSVTP